MVVKVQFDTKTSTVYGEVTHSFEALRSAVDSIFWDAPGIKILAIEVMNLTQKQTVEKTFETNTEGLITRFPKALTWGDAYSINIRYEAQPRKGIYFIGWNAPEVTDARNQTRKQIWTQGQGIDNRHWIPMYDDMNDKFITETITTFDQDYKVLSNGNLKSVKDNKDGTKTWHYCLEKPHAGYLLMLAIDKFGVKETKTSRGTPVQFWYYPEHPEKVEYSSMHTEKIIEFLEDETGFPYAWGAYSQVMVQDFMYGAMENTSATIFGDFFNVDENSFNDRNYISVNAHELTHQWFGDLVTARNSTGTWLQESFATYYAKLFMGALNGPDEYAWSQRGEVNSALAAGQKDDLPIANSGSGTARVYPKGSTVLHMLRYVLGDAEYKKVIKHYLDEHAFGNVETVDLEQACEDALGRNMDWFFDQWIYRGGEPHYKVERKSSDNRTTLIIEQIHPQEFSISTFKMPVNIGIYFSDGKKIEKQYWIENRATTIDIEHKGLGVPSYALFDIGSDLLKSLSMEKSDDELIAQFQHADHMIDRYDALVGLKKTSLNKKQDVLKTAFSKESFWAMRAEIIQQLLLGDDQISWIIEKLKTEDVRVRSVVLNECKKVSDYEVLFMDALKDKSYNNQIKAMTRLVREMPNLSEQVLTNMQDKTGQNQNIRLAWIELKAEQLLKTGNSLSDESFTQYAKELDRYCSNLYEFRTRTSAFAIVERLNVLNETNAMAFIDASLNPNSRLAGPAAASLNRMRNQYQNELLFKKVMASMSFSDSEKEILAKYKLL
jgi:aminopeptidase N